jgi:dUTP pyrophosphatase
MELKIKALSPKIGQDIPFPHFATAGAAAMDLCACIDAPVTIPPHGRQLIPNGIAIALPGPEYVALVFARSGLASRNGIAMANGVGVIDSDYRGELATPVINQGDEPYTVQPGDRIAQLMVVPVVRPELVPAAELDETERGAGGFGSTGR